MLRLTRPNARRTAIGARTARVRRDDGAVSTIVAILAASGLLLGIGALVVDVGQIFAERRQLQNGADAAALALAQDCAADVDCDAAAGTATSQVYADANARDGATGVDNVCGNAGTLPSCPAPSGSIYDCEPTPPAGTEYVEVRTRTRTGGGSTLLPPTFARALAGNAAYDGTSVTACSRASWGPPAQARTLAMTISLCEWDAMTSGGTTYAPAPPYPPNPSPSAERKIALHGSGNDCAGSVSGWDLPGGFGWVDDTESCQVDIEDETYSADPGVSAPSDCRTALEEARTGRYPVYLPIYDGVTGTGNSVTYHLKGFAAFIVTGYSLPGLSAPSWLTGTSYCSGADKCVYGFFTEALAPGDEIGTGPDLGLRTVVMIP